MRFLFSGADHSLSAQPDKSKSLGGYMSSTPIPNGRPGALFSAISAYSQKYKLTETLAFFIYNDTQLPITNISLQQIYEDILGTDENEAEFEWAAVEPTDDHKIELIGTSQELPFFADFFNPTTKRESCILRVLTAAATGETFTLLGENITFLGSTVEDMVDEIVLHFKTVDAYFIDKYSSDSIYIRNQALLATNAVVQITSIGTASSNTVNLSGFVDGETILTSSLGVGKSLGIWVKRKVKPEILIDFDEVLNKEECLEVLFSYD